MGTALDRFYRNPAVMVPWCERVGLDPERIPVAPFEIIHEGDQHFALYELAGVLGEPFQPSRTHRLAVDVLPFPCALHPDVPAIGLANGRDAEVSS